MSDQLNIEQLREEIKRQMRLQRQVARYGMLAGHVGMFALFSVLSIIFLAQAGQSEILKNLPKGDAGFLVTPLILLWIGWGTGVFFHLMAILNEAGLFEKANKRILISRALADQLLKEVGTDSEKPKRKPTAETVSQEMRLTDEGELAPADDEIWEEAYKSRNSRGRK